MSEVKDPHQFLTAEELDFAAKVLEGSWLPSHEQTRKLLADVLAYRSLLDRVNEKRRLETLIEKHLEVLSPLLERLYWLYINEVKT